MTPDRGTMIDKLSKMRDKLRSVQEGAGTEAEAMAFAAKIAELLTKHKIEEHELREAGGAPVDERVIVVPVPHGGFTKYAGKNSKASGFPLKQVRVQWTERLASIVAEANFCQFYVYEGRNSISFVGTKTDAETSIETFVYLAATAEQIAWIEYQKFFDASAANNEAYLARGFRKSFLLGFVTRLAERYRAERERMRAEWAANTSALVCLKNAVTKVRDFMTAEREAGNTKISKSRAAMQNINGRGYAAGRDKADEIKMGEQAAKLAARPAIGGAK